jgi:hypothetical protein
MTRMLDVDSWRIDVFTIHHNAPTSSMRDDAINRDVR